MFDLSALGKGIVLVAGSFVADTTAVPACKGVGFTVAHTSGANPYVVTFTNTYDSFIGVLATYEKTATSNVFAQIKSWSAGVLTIDLINVSGSAVEGAGRLNFVAIFKKGTV